jgi:protein O-GlcNAc transferase
MPTLPKTRWAGMLQTLQEKLHQAVALQEAGRLAEAQAAYQEILKLKPNHFDSLHLSGVIAIQTGNLALGISLIDKAITVNPIVADAYNNRGYAFWGLGKFREALASY